MNRRSFIKSVPCSFAAIGSLLAMSQKPVRKPTSFIIDEMPPLTLEQQKSVMHYEYMRQNLCNWTVRGTGGPIKWIPVEYAEK